MLKFILKLSFLFISLTSLAQPLGYNYGKIISVSSGQVSGSSTLVDFPVLISIIDSDLRSVSNSGHVENVNGYDIVFTLSNCSSILDHQLEKYDPVTGELIVWVKIPTLFATTNTNIHMYYGNNFISNSLSKESTWASTYGSVWHMNQSPSLAAPQLIDYTSNKNNGTANGSMTASDLVAGKIGYGVDFDGSNDFFDCGNSSTAHPTSDLTVSAWVKARATNGHIINCGGGWSDPGYSLFHLGNRIRIELQRSGEKDILDNSRSADNQWHHIALTYKQSTGVILCYIDGVAQSNSRVHTGPIGTPVENLNIGRKQKNGYYFNGVIDEGRVILEEKSSDWLMTEYNNQNNPSAFYSVGSEQSASFICGSTLPVEFMSFDVFENDFNEVDVIWETASEINNNFFTIQSSKDAKEWEELSIVEGAGNSTNTIRYNYIDNSSKSGIVYYRIKQTDFDGQTSYSTIKYIKFDEEESTISVYPNPTKDILNVTCNDINSISVYNTFGEDVTHLLTMVSESDNKVSFSTSRLTVGTYIIKSNETYTRFLKVN